MTMLQISSERAVNVCHFAMVSFRLIPDSWEEPVSDYETPADSKCKAEVTITLANGTKMGLRGKDVEPLWLSVRRDRRFMAIGTFGDYVQIRRIASVTLAADRWSEIATVMWDGGGKTTFSGDIFANLAQSPKDAVLQLQNAIGWRHTLNMGWFARTIRRLRVELGMFVARQARL